MRVALDAQLTLGTATGIGEYLQGLIPALQAQGVELDILCCERYDPWRFDRRVLWDQLILPLSARKATLLHCPSGTMPMFRRKPTLVTVHDIAWLRVQAHTHWYARTYFGALMLRLYRQAQKIIVVSEFSRRELLQVLDIAPQHVVVIHNGVDAAFGRVLRQPCYEPPTILAVGTIESRKNLGIVIEALGRMRNRSVRLLAPGPATPYLAQCAALALRLGVLERVEFLGYLGRPALLRLYATAALAVIPSRYEGFGYGAAQAMLAGVPLVASSASSLPEIVGAEGILIDPLAVEEWAEAMDRILENPLPYERAAQAIRAGTATRFAWSMAARQTRVVYESLTPS